MNKDRLNRLSGLLRQPLPESVAAFDMNYYHAELRKADRPEVPWKNGKDCGTVCCALGLAASDSVFQNLGLKINYDEVVFDDLDGTDAGAAFFDISDDDASELFYPTRRLYGDDPIKPETVADVIDRYVAGETLDQISEDRA